MLKGQRVREWLNRPSGHRDTKESAKGCRHEPLQCGYFQKAPRAGGPGVQQGKRFKGQEV